VEASDVTFPILLTVLILLATLIPLTVIFGLTIWWLRRKKTALTRQWEREGVVFLRGLAAANFSGLESKGMGQVRGNGFIALTGQDLRITRAVPAAEWRIPHQQIKQVALEPSFLGKRRGMKVLVITFEQEGQPDRIGVYVRNGADWVEVIANAANL
jgi:hypothetical protein